MRKETDLARVKMIAHVLLDMPIAQTPFSPAIVSHPFTSTGVMLDLKQQILADRIAEHPEISVVWFRADKKKDGGQYVTTTGQLKKVDDIERTLRLVDGTTIPLDDVLELRSDCFHGIFQDG